MIRGRDFIFIIGISAGLACNRQEPLSELALVAKTTNKVKLRELDESMKAVVKYDKQFIARKGGDFTESEAKAATTAALLKKFLQSGGNAYWMLYDEANYGFLRATYSSASARELYKRPDVAMNCLLFIEKQLQTTASTSSDRAQLEYHIISILKLLDYPIVRDNALSQESKCSEVMTRIIALTEQKSVQDNLSDKFVPMVKQTVENYLLGRNA